MCSAPRRATAGSAFVEILQNCNIYNDGAFAFVREDKGNRIYLEHGERIRLARRAEGIQQDPDGSLRVVDVAEAGEARSSSMTRRTRKRPRVRALADHVRYGRRRCRSASSARSSEVYDDLMSAQLDGGGRARARATWRRSPLGRHLDNRRGEASLAPLDSARNH